MFSLLVLLGLVLFQEILFRLTFPLPEVSSFNRGKYMVPGLPEDVLLQAAERGVHNVTIRWDSVLDGAAYLQHLNLNGFRGPNFSINRTRRRHRLLFVGDSFVEGVGAADDETITEQFMGMMGRRVEAINLGVSGIAYSQYTRLVRDSVALLRPDAVFLVTCSNDLPVVPMEPEEWEPAPEFRRESRWMPRLLSLTRRLQEGLPLPRVYSTGPFGFFAAVPSLSNPLTWYRPEMQGRSDRPKWVWPTEPKNIDPVVREAMSQGRLNPWLLRTLEWLDKALRHDYSKGGSPWAHLHFMSNLCRTQGIHFYMVYIPCNAAANPDYLATQKRMGGDDIDRITTFSDAAHRRQQEHLRQCCQSMAIPFLDLTDEFIRLEAAGTRAFWSFDSHCTAAGYRLVAEWCARIWREEQRH